MTAHHDRSEHDLAAPALTLAAAVLVGLGSLSGQMGDHMERLARRALRLSRRAEAEAVASLDCGSTHAAQLSVQP